MSHLNKEVLHIAEPFTYQTVLSVFFEVSPTGTPTGTCDPPSTALLLVRRPSLLDVGMHLPPPVFSSSSAAAAFLVKCVCGLSDVL